MHAEDGAHFIVAQAFDMPEHKRLAIEERQRLDSLVEFPRQLRLLAPNVTA